MGTLLHNIADPHTHTTATLQLARFSMFLFRVHGKGHAADDVYPVQTTTRQGPTAGQTHRQAATPEVAPVSTTDLRKGEITPPKSGPGGDL